jgi:hypothetical protein
VAFFSRTQLALGTLYRSVVAEGVFWRHPALASTCGAFVELLLSQLETRSETASSASVSDDGGGSSDVSDGGGVATGSVVLPSGATFDKSRHSRKNSLVAMQVFSHLVQYRNSRMSTVHECDLDN